MACKSKGPGPGAYMLPRTIGFNEHDIRKPRGPQYSFGINHKISNKAASPGPGAYYIQKINRYGNDGTPKFSMRPPIAVKETYRSPGPAAHNVDTKPFFKGKTAPAYSLGSKHFPNWYSTSPPPNAYSVTVNMIKPSSPAFSMRIGLSVKPHQRSPGPATYGRTDLNAKLRKCPAYSLGGRNTFAFKSSNPAPNAYNMAGYKPGKSGYTYSFGVRHSECAPPMVVECDNP